MSFRTAAGGEEPAFRLQRPPSRLARTPCHPERRLFGNAKHLRSRRTPTLSPQSYRVEEFSRLPIRLPPSPFVFHLVPWYIGTNDRPNLPRRARSNWRPHRKTSPESPQSLRRVPRPHPRRFAGRNRPPCLRRQVPL